MSGCKVCESPEIMAQVDDWLDQNVHLDDISSKLSLNDPPILIHRSSIHRHKKKHYWAKLRLRALEKKSNKVGRLVVQYSDWSAAAAKPPTLCFEGEAAHEISADQIRTDDTLIIVGFEPVLRRPLALKPAPDPPQDTPAELRS